ncbi:hypothetical protein PHISCL_05345 [Aspergillus sclerotialis]|uniref:Uncharacterized protein n=1 Tax=Aspergillus sclerotialis TaxID=2070753 RepID=A0A3A2ZZ13_9EURO|nr:hypothetical protein PHISCL_05345 [Aspergillus sclerotialis]
MTSHAKYVVTGDNVVKQTTMGFRGLGIVDLEFLGYDWALQWSRINETDDDLTYSFEVSTGTKSRDGNELQVEAHIGLELKGTRSVNVRKHTSIFYYQKVYHFRNVMWQVEDDDKNAKIKYTTDFDVAADEILAHPTELRGEGEITTDPVKNRLRRSDYHITRDDALEEEVKLKYLEYLQQKAEGS